MLYRLAADAALLLHLTFIVFAVFGAVLAIRWRWIPWLQLPAAAWGVYVELSGRRCPLTTLENHFLTLAGDEGYSGSFVEHHLMPVIYPPGLTTETQVVLAAIVLGVNGTIYGCLLGRRLRAR